MIQFVQKKRTAIWQGKITSIIFSDLPDDENYLKVKWLDKKKDRVLRKYVSGEYIRKIVPIVAQCYTSGAHMK